MRRAPLGRAGALQHRPRRLRQARARPPGDGLGGLAGERAARDLRRAPGALEPLRQRAGGARRRARRPRGDAAAVAAGDRGGLPRHLQARRDPAVDVRALRRRGHPAPAARLGRAARGDRHREPRPDPGRPRRARARDGRRLRAGDGRRLARVRGGRHLGRRPRPALLLVGHDRPRQGHPPRAPLPARPRGVRVLPRRPRRRALPRLRRVGVGRRHLPAARAVALRRRRARAGAQGRLRPRGAPALPLEARRGEHVHHADRAARDDRRGGRRQAATRSTACASPARPASRSTPR